MKSVIDMTRLLRRQGPSSRRPVSSSCPGVLRWLFSLSLMNSSQIKIGCWKLIGDYRWLSHPIQINLSTRPPPPSRRWTRRRRRRSTRTRTGINFREESVLARREGNDRAIFATKKSWAITLHKTVFTVFLFQLQANRTTRAIDPMTRPQK